MSSPDVRIGEDRWLFIRQMTFRKSGDREPAHAHAFDHHTVLFKGRAAFKVKGEWREVSAPALVFIEANEMHEIVAQEDDTQAACIHYVGNLRDEFAPPG